MITNLFLFITITILFKIILYEKKEPELLLLLPFIISTNFFGFLPYSFFSFEGLVQQDDIVLMSNYWEG